MSGMGRAPSSGTAPEIGADGFGRGRVSEIQRARMIAAMAEVCAERGVSNVTVAHVVSRSGVSRRTFYEVFGDREACFAATVEEALASAARYVLPAYGVGARWRERIRNALIALLEFLEDEPFMGRLLVIETLGGGRGSLERRKYVIAYAVAAVDEGCAEVKSGVDPPPLTAEGVVGGVLSVLHSRLLEHSDLALADLVGPLMSMITLPYLGHATARKELARAVPRREIKLRCVPADPLRDVAMRLTYRTARVLTVVAQYPASSNREIGRAAGIGDQGQISKLLTRLHRLGLVQNTGAGPTRGAPNAWALTDKGREVQRAVAPPGASAVA